MLKKNITKIIHKVTFLFKNPIYFLITILLRIPYFRFLRETAENPHPITFSIWFYQKIIGYNRGAFWPMHFTSKVVGHQNISVGVGTYPGYNPGVYIQGTGKLTFGKYTSIGQNSGVLSGGHNIYNHLELIPNETRIGDYCWIGMNSTILPGITLGNHTIVGAGSVVTKSFPEGNCIIAGNPAKKIKALNPNQFNEYEYTHKYIGYRRISDVPENSS